MDKINPVFKFFRRQNNVIGSIFSLGFFVSFLTSTIHYQRNQGVRINTCLESRFRHFDITIETTFSDQFTSKIHQHLIVLNQSHISSHQTQKRSFNFLGSSLCAEAKKSASWFKTVIPFWSYLIASGLKYSSKQYCNAKILCSLITELLSASQTLLSLAMGNSGLFEHGGG